SNSHSTELDLLAPGALITSSVNGGGTANYGGTSMAAPHAAGVAALMLDANPSATPDEIESCMKSTGVPVPDPGNGVTTPRVDALGAVECILPGATPTATPFGENCNGTEPDADCDGCSDAEELGSNPTLGGTRDPNNPWDFYDVPVPTAFDGGTYADKDKAVSIVNDVLAVLEYAGTSDGGACNSGPDRTPGTPDDRCYNQDNNGDTADDGWVYDRSVGATWSGAPNRAITVINDLLLVLAQAGHSCQDGP
ncbi:MAG: flexitail domain-containing putative surface protein, partial [Dehalococcoidia bacterium]